MFNTLIWFTDIHSSYYSMLSCLNYVDRKLPYLKMFKFQTPLISVISMSAQEIHLPWSPLYLEKWKVHTRGWFVCSNLSSKRMSHNLLLVGRASGNQLKISLFEQPITSKDQVVKGIQAIDRLILVKFSYWTAFNNF